MHFLLQYFNHLFGSLSVDVTRWKVAATVSLDLAKEIIGLNLDKNLAAPSGVGAFLLCTSQYHVCLQNMKKNTQSEEKRSMACVEDIFKRSINWLIKHWNDWGNTDLCLKVTLLCDVLLGKLNHLFLY